MADYIKNSKSKKEKVRVSVAEDENAPLDILHELAKDSSVLVRQMVASNPVVTSELLKILSNDEDEDVVMYVANSPSLNAELAKTLSLHKSALVRSSVACNEKTPEEILVLMSEDEDEGVLYELARNTSSPINLLKKLSQLTEIDILVGIGRNPSSTSEVLDFLSKSIVESVREAVADNVNTSPHILELLAGDSFDIKLCVAGNKSTPVSVLQLLAKDKDKYIKEAAINNPSANISIAKDNNSQLKKFDLEHVAQRLFEAFNSDGGLIVDTDVKKSTILMLRSGSSVDKQYTLTIEKTKDHEDFMHQSALPHVEEDIVDCVRHLEGVQLSTEEDRDCLRQNRCEDAQRKAGCGVRDVVRPCQGAEAHAGRMLEGAPEDDASGFGFGVWHLETT